MTVHPPADAQCKDPSNERQSSCHPANQRLERAIIWTFRMLLPVRFLLAAAYIILPIRNLSDLIRLHGICHVSVFSVIHTSAETGTLPQM